MSKAKWAALWTLRAILRTRYGLDAWEHFVWELTPYPFGPPSWKQIAFGFRWALRLPGQTLNEPE